MIARPDPTLVQIIGDDELIQQLAAAGRPGGLAYVDGKPTVLFRNR